jgi:hypothetical protein
MTANTKARRATAMIGLDRASAVACSAAETMAGSVMVLVMTALCQSSLAGCVPVLNSP